VETRGNIPGGRQVEHRARRVLSVSASVFRWPDRVVALDKVEARRAGGRRRLVSVRLAARPSRPACFAERIVGSSRCGRRRSTGTFTGPRPPSRYSEGHSCVGEVAGGAKSTSRVRRRAGCRSLCGLLWPAPGVTTAVTWRSGRLSHVRGRYSGGTSTWPPRMGLRIADSSCRPFSRARGRETCEQRVGQHGAGDALARPRAARPAAIPLSLTWPRRRPAGGRRRVALAVSVETSLATTLPRARPRRSTAASGW